MFRGTRYLWYMAGDMIFDLLFFFDLGSVCVDEWHTLFAIVGSVVYGDNCIEQWCARRPIQWQ